MSILTDRQKKFLELVGENDWLKSNFYLGGGTALAEYYLQHRYSEDLDFFTESEVDVLAVDTFLKKVKGELGFTEIDSQTSFNRNLFFLKFDDEVLKTEFTYYPFSRIEMSESKNGLVIDGLIDIAVNKVFTIYQRPRSRDYIDLYFIMQQENWELDDLVKKAKIKFDWHVDPLQLGAQLMKATEVGDYPRMINDIDHKVWQDFFIEEAGKLEQDVLD